MQIPSRPSSLKEIPLEIARFNKAQLNLYQCQEEYKKKVGLSGHTRNNLPFHPKALETELNDIKDHFNRLSTNYVEFLGKEKLLQCMLQEPPLEITELNKTEAEEKAFKSKLDHYIHQVDEFGRQIATLTQSIEQTRSKTLMIADEETDMLDQINLIEEEIADIHRIVSKQSQRTIEEAKSLLKQQTADITKLNKSILNKKDTIADQKWHVEDLEEEVRRLQSNADKINAEANKAIYISHRKDERVEKTYYEYVKTTELCDHLLGVDKIDFESNSKIHIFLKNTVLHVEIDVVKNEIHDVKITGTTVPIDDLIDEAKQTTANDGMRRITLEVLARLKKL